MESIADNISLTNEELSDLEDLVWSLNDLFYDLNGAGLIFSKISGPLERKDFMAISRVVIGSTVISLCKLHELHRRYGKLINKYFNDEIGSVLKSIVQRVNEGGFIDYRNSYVAHPLERNKRGGSVSPAPYEELQKALGEILEFKKYDSPEKALASYLEWINHQGSEDSVMQLLKKMITQADLDLNLGKRT